MSLVEPPTCPVCHKIVSIRILRERMDGNFFSAGNRTGVLCDKCGAQLRVRHLCAFVIVATAVVVAMAATYYAFTFPKGSARFALLALGALLTVLMARRLSPYFLALERTKPGEELFVFGASWETPSSRAKQLQEETFAGQPFQPEPIKGTNESAGQPWRCGTCSSDNPATFDICWNCEKGRAARDI
jgi:hypothetical protein